MDKQRILVVDDETEIMDLVEIYLKNTVRVGRADHERDLRHLRASGEENRSA